jgi:hypothetical protein
MLITLIPHLSKTVSEKEKYLTKNHRKRGPIDAWWVFLVSGNEQAINNILVYVATFIRNLRTTPKSQNLRNGLFSSSHDGTLRVAHRHGWNLNDTECLSVVWSAGNRPERDTYNRRINNEQVVRLQHLGIFIYDFADRVRPNPVVRVQVACWVAVDCCSYHI